MKNKMIVAVAVGSILVASSAANAFGNPNAEKGCPGFLGYVWADYVTGVLASFGINVGEWIRGDGNCLP